MARSKLRVFVFIFVFLFPVHLIWLFQSASSDLSPLPVHVDCGGGLGGPPTVVVCFSGGGFSCLTEGGFPLQWWLCSHLSVLLQRLFVVFLSPVKGKTTLLVVCVVDGCVVASLLWCFRCCGGCVVGDCTSSVVWLGLVWVVLFVLLVSFVLFVLFVLCCCSSFFVQLGGNFGVVPSLFYNARKGLVRRRSVLTVVVIYVSSDLFGSGWWSLVAFWLDCCLLQRQTPSPRH